MPASVRVERKAYTDPRISILAAELGVDKFSALGRLCHLWGWCTEQGSHEVPETVAKIVMDHPEGAKGLVKAELAEWTAETTLRIAGTRGRIEWLGAKRAAAQKGGRARIATGARDAGGRFQPKAKSPKVPSPEALACADYFRKSIRAWFPDCRELGDNAWRRRRTTWAKRLDSLHGPEATWLQIESVIQWSSAHEFWRDKILSPTALAKHFSKLVAQMRRPLNGAAAAIGNTAPTPASEMPATGQGGVAL